MSDPALVDEICCGIALRYSPDLVTRIAMPAQKSRLESDYAGLGVGAVAFGLIILATCWRPDSERGREYAAVVAATFFCLAIGGWWLGSRWHTRVLRQRVGETRRRRLELVLRHRPSDRRRADRLVQHALLAAPLSLGLLSHWGRGRRRRSLANISHELPAGYLSAFGAGRVREFREPIPGHVYHDPIDVLDLRGLSAVRRLAPSRCFAFGPDVSPDDPTAPKYLSPRPVRLLGCPQWLMLSMAAACLLAVVLVARSHSPFWVIVGAAVLCILLPYIFRRTILGERTLVVPGGIIQKRHPLWRRRGAAIYARRSATPLIWDYHACLGYVRLNSGVASIPFGWAPIGLPLVDGQTHVHLPLLDAWLSLAPSPSVEEIQRFLGPRIDLLVAG